MHLSPPSETDFFVVKLLDKLKVNHLPELVPVCVEEYAKQYDCFLNVEEKVRRDGGSINYGWAIHKTNILCEAERHAVWENEKEDLLDITPKDAPCEHILFVSDNEGFEYTGQIIDNVRINITRNQVVDDFIRVNEALSIIYSFGTRVDYSHITLPEPANELLSQYESLKDLLQAFIYSGGTPQKPCICGRAKSYKNCHGKTMQQNIQKDMKKLRIALAT